MDTIYALFQPVDSQSIIVHVPLSKRITELSKELANCDDDARALELAQELQMLLHEQIEQFRQAVANFPLLSQSSEKNQRA